MGMPLELNTILKLSPNQGYPSSLIVGNAFVAIKQDYRLFPLDISVPLVNKEWRAYADVIIFRLTWEKQRTILVFEVVKTYEKSVLYKH